MTIERTAFTAPTTDHREQVFTSPFLTPAENVTPSTNPFDQQTPAASSRDPYINSEVQDYARELSSLLNRMPTDILTPLIQGLRIQQPSNVPTSDLLGLTNDWPSPIPIPEVPSINPFDSLAPVDNYQLPPPQYPPSMASTDVSPTPSSMVSTVPSDASFLTIPEVSNRIHVTHNGPQDRYTFNPAIPSSQFPVKLYFIKRFVYRRAAGLQGTVFRWHFRLEETFPNAFHQWHFALTPGEYIFEDFGNPLVIVGQRLNSEPILFTFPFATSSAWSRQGIHQNGMTRPLTYSDQLNPCYLPCTLTRGPRIGSFLHPSCYGVPGSHEGVNKKSHQAYYVPTSVFQHDGIIITQAYAQAFARGRAASGSSGGGMGMNPLKAFHNLAEAKSYLRTCTQHTVAIPEVVPYISAQLEELDLLDDGDSGPAPVDPIPIANTTRGRHVPMLSPARGGTQTQILWAPTRQPPTPEIHIPDHSVAARSCPPSPVPSAVTEVGDDTTATATSSMFSVTDERERSKDRMESIKTITALPTTGEALREWVLNLNWVLSGDVWCDAHGTHATDILETTPTTKSLSKDLLSVLTTAATKHTSSMQHHSARALLEDTMGDVDGNLLVKQGKCFEMFQLRIKTGFSRGLGTEAITHLKEYIAAMHLSLEPIGAYVKRKGQLYTQICLTKGCELGSTARTAFLLDGLQRGAYQDVLKPWVNRILLGQGKLKLTSDVKDLQQAATDLLATSTYYKGNVLQAGKTIVQPSARAATDTASPSTTGDTSNARSDDPILEGIVQKIRTGMPLSKSQTQHLRNTFSCPHCLSNTHAFERCHQLNSKYYMKIRTPRAPSDQASTPGGKESAARANAPAKESTSAPPTEDTTTTAEPPAKAAAATAPGEDSADDSEAYESDSGFLPLDYDSDPDLLSNLSQQARRAAAEQTIIAKLSNSEASKWVKVKARRSYAAVANQGKKVTYQEDVERDDLAKLAEANENYPPSTTTRTLCPDSGTTSTMCPHRDMFVDYVDLSQKGRVVRLGDNNKTIPILGKGTMCFTINAKHLAMANALYVPDL
jgi:hypothetical protein